MRRQSILVSPSVFTVAGHHAGAHECVKPRPHPPILPAAQGTSTDTTVPEDEGHPDAACHSGLAFGLLAKPYGKSQFLDG